MRESLLELQKSPSVRSVHSDLSGRHLLITAKLFRSSRRGAENFGGLSFPF
jgi:hypothetical protein